MLQRRVVAEREAAATRLRLTEQVCYLVITPMTAATRLRLTEEVRLRKCAMFFTRLESPKWLTVNVLLSQVGGARAAALHAELDALRSRLKLTDRQTTGLALAAAPRADAPPPPPPALASPPPPALELASPPPRIRTASPPARHRRRLTPSLLGRPDSREAHHLLCPP